MTDQAGDEAINCPKRLSHRSQAISQSILSTCLRSLQVKCNQSIWGVRLVDYYGMSLLRTRRTSRTPGLRSGADLPSNVSRCIRQNTITTIPQFHPPSAATLKVRFGTCGSAVCLKVMTLPCLLLCASACSECHINRSERRDSCRNVVPRVCRPPLLPQFLKDTYIVHLFRMFLFCISPSTDWQQPTANIRWCVTLYICCRCSVFIFAYWTCWIAVCWVLQCLRSDML